MPVRSSALTASTDWVWTARQSAVRASMGCLRREYSRQLSSRNRACSSSLGGAQCVILRSKTPPRCIRVVPGQCSGFGDLPRSTDRAGRSPLCPARAVRFGHANHTSPEAPPTQAHHPGRPCGAAGYAGHRPPRPQHAPDPGQHENWGNPQPFGCHSPLAHPVGVNRTAGSGLSVLAFVHALAHAEVGDSSTPKPAATTKVSSRSATA